MPAIREEDAQSSGSEIDTDGEYDHEMPKEFPTVLFMAPDPSQPTPRMLVASGANSSNSSSSSGEGEKIGNKKRQSAKQAKASPAPVTPATEKPALVKKKSRRGSVGSSSSNKPKLERRNSHRSGLQKRRSKARSIATATVSSGESQEEEGREGEHHSSNYRDPSKTRHKSSRRGGSQRSLVSGQSQSASNIHSSPKKRSSTKRRASTSTGRRNSINENMPLVMLVQGDIENRNPQGAQLKRRSSKRRSSVNEKTGNNETNTPKVRVRSSSRQKAPELSASMPTGLDLGADQHSNAGNTDTTTPKIRVRRTSSQQKTPDHNDSTPEGLDRSMSLDEVIGPASNTATKSSVHRTRSRQNNPDHHSSMPAGLDFTTESTKNKSNKVGRNIRVRRVKSHQDQPGFNASTPVRLDFERGGSQKKMKTPGSNVRVRRSLSQKKTPDFNASMPAALDLKGGGVRSSISEKKTPDLNGAKPALSDSVSASTNNNSKKGDTPGHNGRVSRSSSQKRTPDFNASMPSRLDFISEGAEKTKERARRNRRQGSARKQRKPDFNASMPSRLDFSEAMDGNTNDVKATRRTGRRQSGSQQKKPDFNGSMSDFSLSVDDIETINTGAASTGGRRKSAASQKRSDFNNSSDLISSAADGEDSTRGASKERGRRRGSLGSSGILPEESRKSSATDLGRRRSQSPRGFDSSMPTRIGLSASIGPTGMGPSRRKSRDFNASMPDKIERGLSRKRSSRRSMADRSKGHETRVDNDADGSLVSATESKKDNEALLGVMTADKVYELYAPELGYFDWKNWSKEESAETKKERMQSTNRRRSFSDRMVAAQIDRSRPARRKTIEVGHSPPSTNHEAKMKSDREKATNAEEEFSPAGGKVEKAPDNGFTDFTSAKTPSAVVRDFAVFENTSFEEPERFPESKSGKVNASNESTKEPARRRLSGSNMNPRSSLLIRQSSTARELGKLTYFMSSIDALAEQNTQKEKLEQKEVVNAARCCVIL